MKENAEAHKTIVESSEYRAEIQKTGDEWLVSVFSGHVRLLKHWRMRLSLLIMGLSEWGALA